MLELLLTRRKERETLIAAATRLRFLVLDELHTYRGRQGADVAMLVRRVRDASGSTLVRCVGTSATMTTEGPPTERRKTVARVASQIFGLTVSPVHVVGETLRRVTRGSPDATALARCVDASEAPPDVERFVADPLAGWVEERFGLEDRDGVLERPRQPSTVVDAAPKDLLHRPRSLVAAHSDLRQWTLFPSGGHFAAAEEPSLVTQDIRSFVRPLRRAPS